MKDHSQLKRYLNEYGNQDATLQSIQKRLDQLSIKSGDETASLIELYDEVYPVLEKQLWSEQDFDHLLKLYQALFREQESLIELAPEDTRYDFLISIPIADRPEHLRCCLESILQLCLLYGYGGKGGEYFAKIQVVVAEDSRNPECILQDEALCGQYSRKGLKVTHFAQQEQYRLLQSIPQQQRQHLASILTSQGPDDFSRKGQAAMRNLSYLKMLQLARNPQRTLFFPVDSDQTFEVNVVTTEGERVLPAINYFYAINRLFEQHDITMLTGKLVGDPPVSPAVMTANFLLDVTHFVDRLSRLDAKDQCAFHQADFSLGHDAAYHDMSSLFGFKNPEQGFDYPCPLSNEHNNLGCLNGFATQLPQFFSGQHPTRKTHYKHDPLGLQPQAARTVYPGNYVVNYSGLKYVIPFGQLRLRMSGPTAGRLLQAEIGGRFVTANLPMLHTRTRPGDELDFRPGVEVNKDRIDLSDEFERQFFGDLMLFSVAELTSSIDLRHAPDREVINQTLHRVLNDMLTRYQQKHEEVLSRLKVLEHRINDANQWWHQLDAGDALAQIRQFCDNVRYNFGQDSSAYQLIYSLQHREMRCHQITEALMQYPQARDAWDTLF